MISICCLYPLQWSCTSGSLHVPSTCRFLQCREQWLAQLVSELDDVSVYEYLKRLTDVHRLQLFDVIMQFRAIFSDEAAPQYPPPKHGTSSAPAPESDGGAVYSWAEHRL